MTRDPIDEAADPTTPAERLEELGGSAYPAEVRQVAMRNPNLLLSTLLIALEVGTPDAWANPATTFALLEGGDEATKGARVVYVEAVREGRQELAEALYEHAYPLADAWWQSAALSPTTAAMHLLLLGLTAGVRSHEHRRAVRLGREALALVIAQHPDLASDRHWPEVERALGEVDRWLEGREIDLETALALLPVHFPHAAQKDRATLLPEVGPLVRKLVRIAEGEVDSTALGGLLHRVQLLLRPATGDAQERQLRHLIADLHPHYPLPVGFSP